MKAAEAKTKICPFMSRGVKNSSYNIELTKIFCELGNCMAWEWEEIHPDDARHTGKHTFPTTEGYCKRLEK